MDTFQLKGRDSLKNSQKQITPKGNAKTSVVSSLKIPSSLERSNEEFVKYGEGKPNINSKSSKEEISVERTTEDVGEYKVTKFQKIGNSSNKNIKGSIQIYGKR